MSANSREELWRQLSNASLVRGDVPAATDPRAPWYVRAMLGAAGWIGAMFLLGFVGAGLAFVFRSEATSLVVGACCSGLACFVINKTRGNDLASQFGLAVSLAGQSMFVYGLHELMDARQHLTAFFIGVAIFEAVLTVLAANFVHRVLSATACSVALWFAMYDLGLYGVPTGLTCGAVAALWLNEAGWSARGNLWRPVAYGLTFTLLLQVPNATAIFGSASPPAFNPAVIPWIRSLLVGGVMVYVVYQLLTRSGTEPSSTLGVAALLAAVAVSAATFKAWGVASALIVLVLGFARGNRTLIGVGVVGMLGYLAYFYYSLQLTLLAKSGALIGTGVTLVLLWVLGRTLFLATPTREPADA